MDGPSDDSIHRYASEIKRQGVFADLAMNDLASSVAEAYRRRSSGESRGAHPEPFAAAQALLTSGAQLSKLFWPPKPWDKSLTEYTEARGKKLCAVFNPDPMLQSREVRNIVEHFDERLDKITSAPYVGMTMDASFMPAETARSGSGIILLRNLDPDALVYLALDNEVDLRQLHNVIREVAARADAWLTNEERPRTRP